MPKIKGFALLGRATSEQLRNYKLYYSKFVDFNIKPICEIHKYLEGLVNKEREELLKLDQKERELKEIEVGSFEELLKVANELETQLNHPEVIKWSRNRSYIAYWEIDRKDLPEVAKLWIEFKQIKIREIEEARELSGDSEETWHWKNRFPEYNGDDEE